MHNQLLTINPKNQMLISCLSGGIIFLLSYKRGHYKIVIKWRTDQSVHSPKNAGRKSIGDVW